jgi:xylose isomerase
MDSFARGLKIAAKIIEDGAIENIVKQRYSGWDSGIGAEIESGKVGYAELEAYTLKNGEPTLQSGRQELVENVLNEYIR